MSSITTQPPIADADDAIQQRQKRAALAVAMLGFAVVALDAQITNVALPAIRQHLGGGLSGLQWVTGQATRHGDASGGWQRYAVRPAEVWCFDSRIDHERHQISTR